MSAELKKQVCDIIDGMADELVDASHAIHAKPEIAFEEKFAHGLLTDKVEAAGLTVERHACGLDTAFISHLAKATRKSAFCRNMMPCPASAMPVGIILSPQPASAHLWRWPS